mmetsp:Transcript_29766/g.45370  ORF Transcript_29766/g.45370 Transcript_29766/m.45370 type:complete len:124 (+) Transcript_29766:1315-1686(+)
MSGLQTLMYCFRRHEHDFNEQFASSIMQFGKNNFVEMMTSHLRNATSDNLEYLRFVQDIFNVSIVTAKGKKAFVNSGALHILIDMCLQHAEIEATSSIAITEREVSLSFLTDIWKLRPEVIQN